MSELRSIVDRMHEVFNARDFDAYPVLLSEDVELDISGFPIRGLAAVTDYVAVTARARPGLRIGPQRVFVETEDTLVAEFRIADTTEAGPTDQASTLETSACGLYRAEGGRIAGWRVYVDPTGGDMASAAVAAVAAEQSALRRMAELVARQAPSEQVFALVAEELSHLLQVSRVRTLRFEADGSVTVLAGHAFPDDPVPPGTNVPIPEGSAVDKVFRTGRPARVDDHSQVRIPGRERKHGARQGVAGPIVVDGRLWGAMAVGTRGGEALPAGSEDRVAAFAELVSTAISNIESRAKVERLAAEQSALRRVAEVVARQAPSEQVFAVVTEELSELLRVSMVRTLRFEPDGTVTVLAAHGITDDRIPPGTNVPIPEGSVIEQVFRTRRPARLDDYSQVRGPVGAILRAQGARSGVAGPIVVDGQLWGAMVVAAQSAQALPPGSEDRVAQFAELVSTAISNIESRAKVERLAAEQSALRRVAELVARQAPSEQVFAGVAEELSHLLDVDLVRAVRFESDGSVTVVAASGAARDRLGPGTNLPLPRGTVIDEVFRTGAPARVEDYEEVAGTVGDVLRDEGARIGAGGPIVVDGRLWGAMAVGSTAHTLPPGTEDRVAEFGELVSTAISNIESRAKVERLAAEQSALRRVATLVASEHSPDDLFGTLVQEIRVLLGVDASEILRYETDGTATMVAGWSDSEIQLPLGERLPLEGENLANEVQRTGVPGRKEDYSRAPGAIAAMSREVGIRSAVASPIVVEGAIWGMIAVATRRPQPLPPDTEARLAEFSRVAGMAVANAKSRSDLAESRARIVRAGDQARRRLERDLHDGAQQRLVSLGLELSAAEATVPAELGEVRRVLSRVETGLSDVLDNVRELSRGLHPAVLSEDGLGPALRSLALRSSVPVDLRIELDSERFDDAVEVAAYYVASEALTNTAKHAHASQAQVRVTHRNGWLELVVSDDGSGGADPSSGSGLTGLVDRVEAIGGTIQIETRADLGTAIQVKLPTRSTR